MNVFKLICWLSSINTSWILIYTLLFSVFMHHSIFLQFIFCVRFLHVFCHSEACECSTFQNADVISGFLRKKQKIKIGKTKQNIKSEEYIKPSNGSICSNKSNKTCYSYLNQPHISHCILRRLLVLSRYCPSVLVSYALFSVHLHHGLIHWAFLPFLLPLQWRHTCQSPPMEVGSVTASFTLQFT